ncbi:MAG TPA: CHAP domain-containing protein [Blastocatellia bacterium]|nr:CHAP domain-containing protein [Blastocatellia bacterium]
MIGPRFWQWNAAVFLSLFFLLSAPSAQAQAQWWNVNWTYRIPLIVEPDDIEQNDQLAAATINFTMALKAARARGVFISSTIRLVEFKPNGGFVDTAVPLQFDLAPDFHATRKAQGTVRFLVKGQTAAPRFFHLYFETDEAPEFDKLPTAPQLSDYLAPRLARQGYVSLEQMTANVGEIEKKPAPLAVRARTVTNENLARSLMTEGEANATAPIWKTKPEHQFFGGYCTWYAARKWKEFTGLPVTWSGDGGSWFENAADEGRSVSDDPKAAVKGAIIVWTRRGAAGHVAFVEDVNEDGIFITEMNAKGRWVVSDAFLPFTNLGKGTKYKFKGYILPE